MWRRSNSQRRVNHFAGGAWIAVGIIAGVADSAWGWQNPPVKLVKPRPRPGTIAPSGPVQPGPPAVPAPPPDVESPLAPPEELLPESPLPSRGTAKPPFLKPADEPREAPVAEPQVPAKKAATANKKASDKSVPRQPDKPPAETAAERPSTTSPTDAPAGDAVVGDDDDKHDISPASFNEVTPGLTSSKEVEARWGAPAATATVGGRVQHEYRLPDVGPVKVVFGKQTAERIVVRLNKPFTAAEVAEHLKLQELAPARVENSSGQTIGAAFPERGVLFTFTADGKQNVEQIILETITPEPFVLRAEHRLASEYSACLADLDYALKLQPKLAEAHWRRGQVLERMGRHDDARQALDKALELEPDRLEFRLTRSKLLERMGDFAAAGEDAKAAVAAANNPLAKARGLCLLGDQLVAGPGRDHKRAIEFHLEAIKLAQPFTEHQKAVPRRAAKELLLDAHLAVANDVAWGYWRQKPLVVPKWLQRAGEIAEDCIAHEGANPELRFRVARQALAACVGANGEIDAAPWVRLAEETGKLLERETKDADRRRELEWELGLAFYDAMQVDQLRNQIDAALKHGQEAVAHMQRGAEGRHELPGDAYLIGRLHFRIGSIYALRKRDHAQAILWYDKAVPLMEQPIPASALADAGRQGATFVSMGVSYWETGSKEEALRLTRQGIHLLEKAVSDEILEEKSLAVPYANIAKMYQDTGDEQEAANYTQLAEAIRATQETNKK